MTSRNVQPPAVSTTHVDSDFPIHTFRIHVPPTLALMTVSGTIGQATEPHVTQRWGVVSQRAREGALSEQRYRSLPLSKAAQLCIHRLFEAERKHRESHMLTEQSARATICRLSTVSNRSASPLSPRRTAKRKVEIEKIHRPYYTSVLGNASGFQKRTEPLASVVHRKIKSESDVTTVNSDSSSSEEYSDDATSPIQSSAAAQTGPEDAGPTERACEANYRLLTGCEDDCELENDKPSLPSPLHTRYVLPREPLPIARCNVQIPPGCAPKKNKAKQQLRRSVNGNVDEHNSIHTVLNEGVQSGPKKVVGGESAKWAKWRRQVEDSLRRAGYYNALSNNTFVQRHLSDAFNRIQRSEAIDRQVLQREWDICQVRFAKEWYRVMSVVHGGEQAFLAYVEFVERQERRNMLSLVLHPTTPHLAALERLEKNEESDTDRLDSLGFNKQHTKWSNREGTGEQHENWSVDQSLVVGVDSQRHQGPIQPQTSRRPNDTSTDLKSPVFVRDDALASRWRSTSRQQAMSRGSTWTSGQAPSIRLATPNGAVRPTPWMKMDLKKLLPPGVPKRQLSRQRLQDSLLPQMY